MAKKQRRSRRQAVEANAGRRRRRRSGRKTLHIILLTIFFLGAGLILSLTVFFKIEAVNVIGTDKYDPLELAEASGVAIGDNLFRISTEEITQTLLEGYPYIQSVEVSRKIPSTVEITVTQCVPGGAAREGDNIVLITKDGKVLERGILYIPEDIPLIKGLNTAGVEPGKYLGRWEKLKAVEDETEEQKAARLEQDAANAAQAKKVQDSLVMLEYLYKAMADSGFTDITNVDISNPLNMKIMYENRLLLELGSEAELSYKLERVRHIIKEELTPEDRGTLHAGNANAPKVVFTPADEAGATGQAAPTEEAAGSGAETEGEEGEGQAKEQENGDE